MLKKHLLFCGLLLVVLALQAQKSKYPFSPSLERFFSDEQIDSMIEAVVVTTAPTNGAPSSVVEKRYSKIKDKLERESWKEVLETLPGKLKGYKKDLKKAPVNSVQYRNIKYIIEDVVLNGVLETFFANPEFTVILNYESSDRIQHFHSDITINKDGSTVVTETITVFNSNGAGNIQYNEDGSKYDIAQGNNEIKRGIVRYIPSAYSVGKGLNYDMGVRIDSVTRNGYPEKYKNDYAEGSEVLYIGSPDKELSVGIHTYKIYYTTNYSITYGDNYDELYWNVTGNGWTMDIDSASCTLHLPFGAKPISNACYTGVANSTVQNCTNTTDYDNGAITFASKNPLKKGEGFTIASSWPMGHINRESTWFIIFLSNFGPLFVLFVGIYLIIRNILLKQLFSYFKNKRGNIIPEFEAPKELNPALAGFIDKLGHHADHITASLVNLAVHKYITIDVEKSGTEAYYKIGAGSETAPEEGEDKPLFAKEGKLLIGEVLYPEKSSKAMAFFGDTVEAYCLEKHGETPFFARKKGFRRWGIFIAWVGILLSSMFMLLHYKPDAYTYSYFIGGIVLCYVANKFFDVSRVSYTTYGRAMMHKIAGFKMFLETADAHRLDVVNRPDANLMLEKYLPWAMALGCDMQWVEKFNDAIAPSLLMETQQQQTFTPRYYYPSSGFTTSSLLHSTWELSRHSYYEDYIDEKMRRMEEEMRNRQWREQEERNKVFVNAGTTPRYPKVEIKREEKHPDADKIVERTFNTDRYKSDDDDDDRYKTPPRKPDPPKPTPPSKGGGHSGGGMGGGGGGGW